MSSEVEWGNWEPSKAPHSVAASDMFNAEFDRQMKVSNYIRSGDDLVAEFDKRTDVVKQLTGVDLGNPMLKPTAPAQYDAMGNVMVPGGMWTDHVTAYKEKLKELADKHPEHKFAIDPDNTPDLIIAKRMNAYEQRSADLAEKAGFIEGKDIPVIGKVPIVRDAAALVRNLVAHPINMPAQFAGSLYAQMHDPVEAPLNILGFGAGRARDAILKTALKNAASNAAIEAAMGPLRQEQRKNYGLDYGWERFFADVSGAAAAGFVLDAAVRTPYRVGITRFGRDVPEGQMFSKQGRGGLLTDAIPQMDPIKPVVREKITPEEYEKARTGDIDAIETIAKKSGAYDDPAVKGMIDYAKTTGQIDDAMVKRFEAMGIDHGEKMATLKAAIDVGGMSYVRMPDPIPQATRALDTAGAAELAPRLAEIDQRLAEAPQSVRQAVRAGLEAGIPEIVDAARKAISGDLEGMRKAIDDAGGEQALTDRVIVHTATNPVTVALALRRSPQVMDSNVSLRTDMMRMARALSALDEPAFRMVLEGKAHPMAGQLVADMVPPGRHAQVLDDVANFRSMDEAKAAIPDLIPEPSRAPEATGTRVSDPAGPEAKAQIEDLEKAHKAEVDRATEPARKREELESKVETLKGEIAKLEEQQGKTAPATDKMFAIADRGKASLDETILSSPEQKLLAKLTERTGLKPDDIAEQRAQGQSFGKKIDAALDKATKFEGAEKAADELATKRQELRAAERELEQVQLDQARTLQDPALFNAVMRRAALQRQLDVRRAIDDALRLGDQMLPEGTRVEVRTDEMVDPASGYRLDASSDMATGDIALASYALNPAGRIGHEGVHTLITKGHVAPEEVNLLAKMARERGLFKDETKYREAYADRDNLDALIDEEAAAHAIEARINGTDIGPANTMADRIKQLIERISNALDGYGFKTADDVARAIIEGRAAEREARAEWMRDNGEQMFALADADTGRSMRADLDKLGYYSKALEAAKSLKQAKGTPEQMLAQLKSAGVKGAEIEATNLKQFLDGKTSITRDEIVKHLTENRVGVNENRYGGLKNADEMRPEDAPTWMLRTAGAVDTLFPPGGRLEAVGNALQSVLGPLMENSINRAAERSRAELGAVGPAKWKDYSLDPSNPTYRETVLHLPDNSDAISGLSGEALQNALAQRKFGRNWSTLTERERNIAMNSNVDDFEVQNFQSGHFSEPNIIGHMMTSMNRHDGKPVFTLDQIQSDWGQKLRDGGVRDEAKIAELKRKVAEAKSATDRALNEGRQTSAMQWPETQEYGRLSAELRTAEAATPGNPLVNTTDQWTLTTLRRALRIAIEADADFIAIPHGDTVLSYNPGDTNGMRGFYGSRTSEGIVPKNLRKLLEKIDKDSAKPLKVESLDTPSGRRGWKENGERNFDKSQTGFTLVPLTDKAKRSVLDEGQAMFALSEYRRGRDVAEPENLWFWQQPQKSGTVLMYHATNRSFDKFDMGMSSDFGLHFGSAKQAAQRLSDTGRIEGGRTIPAEVTVKNAITMGDQGFWGPVGMATALQRQGYKVTAEEWKRFNELADAIDQADADVQRIGNSVKPRLKWAVNAANDAIKAKLNELGIDGIWYKNTAEGRGWSLAVWNEGQVKSAITGEQLYAMREGAAPPDPLKSDMAVVDRMSSLRELIEACR